MEGKKNPYDPAELFKQWLENASRMQSDFTKSVNPFQTNFQNPFNLQNMMPNFLSWSASRLPLVATEESQFLRRKDRHLV